MHACAARTHLGTRASLGACLVALLGGCATARQPGATTDALRLDRVVLYQNGVGYFERAGKVEGDRLRLKVRKDQINDLLKSLAVVDRSSGKVLSVSLPLDPLAWHRAALAALAPGQGQLAQVLDGLRGTPVRAETERFSAAGRIVMVEKREPTTPPDDEPGYEDYTLSLLDGDKLSVVALSQIRSLSFEDGDVVMQLGRQLDAVAGEGMFQQVELSLRLSGQAAHDLRLSYVAPAPRWKPTYRVVLDGQRPGVALLQAWGVVDNVSGENWNAVALSLTAGAPIAFRYDLHTPREVERPDLTESGVHKQARVALGERTVTAEQEAEAMAMGGAAEDAVASEEMAETDGDDEAPRRLRATKRTSQPTAAGAMPASPPAPMAQMAPEAPGLSFDALQQSTSTQARAQRVSGLTRFDLPDRVSLPDGSATMVTLVNQEVRGEQAFLYKPGGSGTGYELNPYRVVRFQNDTAFALEPGPISVYADGSFVGEGLSEAIGSKQTATIPFAVEPSITVRSKSDRDRSQMRIVRIARGVLEVETFDRVATTWTVKGRPDPGAYRVLVRHPRAGPQHTLVDPPPGVEELPDAYFIPVDVPADKPEAEVTVVERTPSRLHLSIWDGQAPKLLDTLLSAGNLDAEQRKKLEPIVEARRKIGRIDTEVASLQDQRATLDQRVNEIRSSLKAVQKDPKAGALRNNLGKRLQQLISEGDTLGRRIVELQSERLEHKIAIEDALETLSI